MRVCAVLEPVLLPCGGLRWMADNIGFDGEGHRVLIIRVAQLFPEVWTGQKQQYIYFAMLFVMCRCAM